MTGYQKFFLLAAIMVVPSACTTVVVQNPAGAIGAQLSVERFLQAANQRDVVAMGQLFGTVDGPVTDTGGTFGCMFKKIGSWFGGNSCVKKVDVEIRMDAIGSILKHDNYQLVGDRRLPGRTSPVREVLVDLTTADGVSVSSLPFVVVQTKKGRWLIEQVDLQRVMSGR